MQQGNGSRARVYDLRALHVSAHRTVAARLVVVEIDHADERQTSLDFDEPPRSHRSAATATAPRHPRSPRSTAQSGVHVIDCDALALDDGEGLEIGGAA